MMALSLRLLRRDWRAGELRVLVAALLIAVTSVTAVAFFTDRIGQALKYQSSELLGADLRLVADHPPSATRIERAQRLGLATAEIRTFRSMILAEGRAQLAEIKAAGPGYPLRGQLRISSDPFAAEATTDNLPDRGELWADPQLLQQLQLQVGDVVQVGEARLRISAALRYEPDRSGDLFSIAPRLLINLADLPATGLEQEGSRMRYALLVAGEQAALERFRRAVKPGLGRGERLEGAADARREVRIALSRAQQFLGLAAVVAVVLACVAIAMGARRFAQRHLDGCAVMRCLGARQSTINRLYVTQLVILALLAGGLGVVLGYLAQLVLASLLGQLVLVSLPAPSWLPVGVGLGVALGGLLGFALPPVLQLRNVSTLRVLRRDASGRLGGMRPVSLASYLFGLLALAALVLFQAGDLALGRMLLLGVVGTAAILWLLAAALVWGLRHLAARGNSAWRFGLSNLTRRPQTAIAQVMAFGVGIMVLLLLTVVRGDLLRGWAEGLPADAPNRFVINIQPDQLDAVQAFFVEQGMADTELFPMVRGRLQAINDEPIAERRFTGDNEQRARHLAEREFNLSWAEDLPPDNAIVGGQWWRPADTGQHLFSVEEGIARTLNLQLGDRLRYRIAGEVFEAEVSSLRSVQWDSFRANFFVLAPPGALQTYPASYITSFYLPAARADLLNALVRQFPNLTVIDIAAIMGQVRLIIERVSLAVEYVFLFTLAAGLAVMFAAIQSTLDERLRENAIFRALGAQRRRLLHSLMTEFATLGGLAGLLAAATASALGYAVARYVLELEYVGNPWLWLIGIVLGALGVGVAGVLGTRRVTRSPPLRVLREN
jgi:putative ABC transport system permease protein